MVSVLPERVSAVRREEALALVGLRLGDWWNLMEGDLEKRARTAGMEGLWLVRRRV